MSAENFKSFAEAYAQIYLNEGRDEMISSNIKRASSAPKPAAEPAVEKKPEDLESLRKASAKATMAGPSKEAQALMSDRTKNILGSDKLKAGVEAQNKVEKIKSSIETEKPKEPVLKSTRSTSTTNKPSAPTANKPTSAPAKPSVPDRTADYERAWQYRNNPLAKGRIKSAWSKMSPQERQAAKDWAQRTGKNWKETGLEDHYVPLKTFSEFILETSAADIPKNDPGYGGGSSAADIDANPNLTDAEKEKYRKFKARSKSVRSSDAGFGPNKQTTQTTPNPNSSSQAKAKQSRAQNVYNNVKNAAKRAASTAYNASPKDAVNAGKQAVSSAKTNVKQAAQNVKQTAQNFKDTAKQAASKVYNASPKDAVNAAKRAVSDASTKMKYGKTIRPDTTGTSALVKSTGDAAKASKGLKVPGIKTGSALSGVIGAADEKSKGSGWARSLAKGATVAAGTALGGLAGGAAGSVAGPVGTAVGGYAGQAAGAAAAGKAFDTVAGANAAERKAMATSNRQRQAGGGLAGIGGKTTFSKGKGGTGFMSTGSGSQRKTVQLDKTSVVKDPKTGKAEVGHLAFKGGKAVYKRAADPSTLAKTSSNPLERVGRSLFAGAYKKSDEQARQAKLKTAAASDVKRQQALGVKGSKNLVGPKIVGPKK